jgi:hypothetical protein
MRDEQTLSGGAERDAGLMLDVDVCEQVMGWPVNRADGRHWHTFKPHRLVGRDCCAENYEGAFCPSQDMDAAWEVAEALKVRGLSVNVHTHHTGAWSCDIWRLAKPGATDEDMWFTPMGSARADKAPLAICRAALKAATALRTPEKVSSEAAAQEVGE